MVELPVSAAWRHVDAREGFEIVFVQPHAGGCRLEGHTTAVEDDRAWVVRYDILLDAAWRTATAGIWSRSTSGEQEVRLDADGDGHWRVNGADAPQLDGCLDVDLEASSCTNMLPVHRLRLGVGERAEAPAAYVRAPDLTVERLEQHYARVDDERAHPRYDYASPAFDFSCQLVYDASGFVLDYPGIATRVA